MHDSQARSGNDQIRQLPPLATAALVGRSAVLDGEVVATTTFREPRLQALRCKSYSPTMNTLAEILRRRGIRGVTWFHTDHWEPWGSGITDASLKRVESFLRQAKASPVSSRMTLFYVPGTRYRVKDRANPTFARDEELLEVVPYSDAEQRRVQSLIGELVSQTKVEFQLHLHHEHVVGSDGNWSEQHRRIKALTDPAQDERRLHFLLRNDLAGLRRHTGAAHDRWAFVHGLWALNGSDRTVCQIDNEIEILMSYGCWGDFSFPAGRYHCDPTTLEQPYTCKPFTAPKGYDDPGCEPIAVDAGAGGLREGRFLIWNSKAKHDVCSFDYHSKQTFELERRADHIVSSWFCNCPVIDRVLYVKTHSHSMMSAYYEEGSQIPLATPGSETIFNLLRRACDGSAVELKLATVNEVIETLREVDGRSVRDMTASSTVAPSHLEAMVSTVNGPGERATAANLNLINQFAVSTLRTWLQAKPEYKRAAGVYYVERLARGSLFVDSELTIAEYSRTRFNRDARFFELGFGYGELSLLLALTGFRATGFEADNGRYQGALILKDELGQRGIDLRELTLVLGVFPDALDRAGLDTGGEAVLVATNVTSSLVMQKIDHVYRSLTLFDHLVIDLSRFGETRNQQSRDALVAKLQELGFVEVERVYSTGDTDIRHFKHEGATPQTVQDSLRRKETVLPQTMIAVPGNEALEGAALGMAASHDRWPLQPPFQPDGGLGWTATLADELHALTDRNGAVDRSPLRLLEDGRQAGVPHVAHAEIRQTGDGRYSFWSDTLYFSTSDGSDPNINGRKYEVTMESPRPTPADA